MRPDLRVPVLPVVATLGVLLIPRVLGLAAAAAGVLGLDFGDDVFPLDAFELLAAPPLAFDEELPLVADRDILERIPLLTTP